MWQMTEGFGLLWQVELGRMRQNWLNLPARPSALTCSIPGPSWIHLNLLIYMIKPTLLFNAFLCIMWVRHYDTVSCSIHPCSCPYIAATPPYLLLTPLPVSLASRRISKPTCTSQRNQMAPVWPVCQPDRYHSSSQVAVGQPDYTWSEHFCCHPLTTGQLMICWAQNPTFGQISIHLASGFQTELFSTVSDRRESGNMMRTFRIKTNDSSLYSFQTHLI